MTYRKATRLILVASSISPLPVPQVQEAKLPHSRSENEANRKDAHRTGQPTQDDRAISLEIWKPPQNWDYQQHNDRETSYVDRFPGTPTSTEQDHVMAPDINALQREVRMMQAAGPQLMLANIKADTGDASEAVVYKEYEMTKKRWMFSALHRYGGFIDLERNGEMPNQVTKGPKVLALYESQGQSIITSIIIQYKELTYRQPLPPFWLPCIPTLHLRTSPPSHFRQGSFPISSRFLFRRFPCQLALGLCLLGSTRP